jgi:hypothetical protein
VGAGSRYLGHGIRFDGRTRLAAAWRSMASSGCGSRRFVQLG